MMKTSMKQTEMDGGVFYLKEVRTSANTEVGVGKTNGDFGLLERWSTESGSQVVFLHLLLRILILVVGLKWAEWDRTGTQCQVQFSLLGQTLKITHRGQPGTQYGLNLAWHVPGNWAG